MPQTGRGEMGSRKHGKSGHAGKSPKLRLAMRREAEAQEKKAKPQLLPHHNVAEAFKRK